MQTSPLNEDGYIIESVRKAVELLMFISISPQLGTSEIARRLGMSKARTYRLLKTLESSRMLERIDDTGRYRLGQSALIIGASAASQIDLIHVSLPIIRTLGERLGETVQLRIRDGDEATCVGKWEPARDLRVSASIGRRRPLGLGSNKVFLAFTSDCDRMEVLDRIYGKNLIPMKRTELEKVLDKIRTDGYCISRGEISEHLVAISAPVFSMSGKLIACLNVVAPSIRVDATIIENCITSVRSAAMQVSRSFGSTAQN